MFYISRSQTKKFRPAHDKAKGAKKHPSPNQVEGEPTDS